MKAIVVNENGAADKSELVDVPTPEPANGEVRVSVEIAGLNYLDIYQRGGALAAPFIAGVEGVGRIDAVGPDLNRDLIGRRVGWVSGQGSFAESAVLPVAKLVEIPAGVSNDDAVALLMQGLTAHYLTTSAVVVSKGSRILVHSAAGGVGRLLVQVARHAGATVIATASTEAKRQIALEAGADHAIDYDEFDVVVNELTDGEGVDVVYDGVGKDTVESDFASLAVRGTLVVIGAASGPPPAIEFSQLAKKSITVIRPSIAHFTVRPGELAQRAKDVFGWVRDGVVTTKIAGRYALPDTPSGLRDLESRSLAGKLVIDIAPGR